MKTIKLLDGKPSAMKIIQRLMVFCAGGAIFTISPVASFMFLFYLVSSIVGVVLFVYLCTTRQLMLSKKVFFLLPYMLIFWSHEWDFGVFSVVYMIIKLGLPFLLYCFLHVTGRAYVITARILCFVLPAVIMFACVAVVASVYS